MNNNIVTLISGRGSNLEAILKSPVGGAVSAVVSDNKKAGGLGIAKQYGKKTFVCERKSYAAKAEFEKRLAEIIAAEKPDLIALAGFMQVLSGDFIAQFPKKIVNIHPSLLPKYPGLNTHRRALEAGEKTHGCTVHWVNEEVDGGEVIKQKEVEVFPDDTEKTLEARVLKAEHILFPLAIGFILGMLLSGKDK